MNITSPSKIYTQLTKLIHGLHGHFYSQTFPLRQHAYLSKKIVACVFSVGERTEQSSIKSIENQILPVSRIELIKNISPISKASNMVFDIAQDADYVLWVDADMILFNNCTQKLLSLAGPTVLYSVAPLTDPVFGKVGYIKLLNMNLAKKLNIHFRDVLGCDKDFCHQAQLSGGKIVIENYEFPRKVLGIHHPTYTAKELFRKNQIERKKRGNRIDNSLLDSLIRSYSQNSNPVLLAGILGEIIPNPDTTTGESDQQSGVANWDHVSKIITDFDDNLKYGFPEKD